MSPAAFCLPCGTLWIEGRVRAVALPSMVTRRGDAIVAAAPNGMPPPEAVEALGAYLRAVAADPALAGPAIRSPRSLGAGVPLAVACGCDWSAPGHWEDARDLWAAFLPRGARDLDARAFSAALGPPVPLAKWLPERFTPRT